MGIRMPDEPIDFGNDCSACWPSGETPERVYVKFQEIIACDPHIPPVCKLPPNDRVFVLDQSPVTPCAFNYSDADWSVGINFSVPGPHRTTLELIDVPGNFYFFDSAPGCAAEGHLFDNSFLLCPALVCAHHGIATVVWKPQAVELLEGINLHLARDLFMEFFPKDDGDVVYRFAKKLDATRIKVLFTP